MNIRSIINHKIETHISPEITIVKVECMEYIMNIMKDALIQIGWKCSIITVNEISEHIKNNSNHYFLFFIATQINKDVVKYKRYILYQLEQNVNNKISVNYNKLHESNSLKQIYDNASLLIDYCELNIKVVNQYYKNKFIIMNIPARNISLHKDTNYVYDIIFIGSMNKRRENILSKLNETYKVIIVDNVYGDDLKQLCNKSNICLNIHYYENAILERVRLNEMMEYGIKIISEKPCNQDINICKYYKSIHFIEMIDNLDELINTIEYIKETPNTKHDLNELEQIFRKDMHQIFKNIK